MNGLTNAGVRLRHRERAHIAVARMQGRKRRAPCRFVAEASPEPFEQEGQASNGYNRMASKSYVRELDAIERAKDVVFQI